MGFYPVHVVVAEARRCGVEIGPVDVNASTVWAEVEGEAIRSTFVAVEGQVQRRGEAISVLARRVVRLEPKRVDL